MKKTFLILSLCILANFSQAQLNDKQSWQEDVTFLKHTIHNKYPNLFYNVTSDEFDKAIDDLITKIPSMQDFEIKAGIGKIMAMFHIGHTQAGYLFQTQNHGYSNSENEGDFDFVPLIFYQFSDGMYVQKADSKYKDLVGAKILQIGDVSTKDALEKIRPYVNYENEQGFIANAPLYLLFPKLLYVVGISKDKVALHLKYEINQQTKDITIPVDKGATMFFGMTGLETSPNWVDASDGIKTPLPLWRQHVNEFRDMIYLPESKTVYLRHSVNLNDKEETIKQFFEKASDFIDANDVEKLVLDLRMNGGGNNQLNKPIITNIVQSKKINKKGKFFCIIGRRTFSAAQNLVNELEKYTEVTFVGEPTSENVNFYGDTKTETLPNSKMQVYCSWLWWQNSDPRDYRKATNPQVSVEMSFHDYQNNSDPVMDAILNYKEQESLREPIYSLVLANKLEDALAYSQNYMKIPAHKYDVDKVEAEINTLGYSFFNQNKLQEAKNVFELNTKLFPNSGNVHDSFGECCLKMGLNEEAKKAYEMALKVQPDYANADVAKTIIKQLKN